MYIDIILKNIKNKTEVARISKNNNAEYLTHIEDSVTFPNVSQIENYDYVVFNHEEMESLVTELLKIKDNLKCSADQKHIGDIINLAKKCKNDTDTVLIFAG